MSNKRLFRLAGGILAATGLVLLPVAFFTAKRQCTILKEWPEVQATVTGSRVLRAGMNEDGDRRMYKTEVEFRYQARGREYTSVAESNYASSNYREMKRKAETYAPGSRHVIKYDPSDPNAIRLEYGYTAGFFLLPLIFGGLGFVLAGAGVPLWLAGRRRRLPDAMMERSSTF